MQQLVKFKNNTGLLLRFALVVLITTCSNYLHANEDSHPQPDLTPQQVVQIVVSALKSNDPSIGDQGIETVYRFASPANKEVTGPLSRFKSMIKGGFSSMLNHIHSEFGEMQVDAGTGLQAVWLTDKAGFKRGYVFQLGKQQSGEFAGSWMTESVWPIGVEKPKGQSI